MGTHYITLEQIESLNSNEITPLIAYAVGLSLFQLKVCEIEGQKYVVGGVNHNSKNVTPKEVYKHYDSLRLLINEDEKYCFKVLANHKKVTDISNNKVVSISPKLGFALFIPFSNKTNDDDIIYIYNHILSISNNLLEYENFLGGLFDGRSSYDKDQQKIACDFNKKYDEVDFDNIVKKLISLGADKASIDINARKDTTKDSAVKSPQFRIKKENLKNLVNNGKVKLFSTKRKSQICS